MHLVLTSDLHGNLPDVPDCNILLIAGDICPDYFDVSFIPLKERQEEWMKFEFDPWMKELDRRDIATVFVSGNHDWINFYLQREYVNRKNLDLCFYLENNSIEFTGYKIWGSPLASYLPGWTNMVNEDVLAEVYKDIPDDVDIIISHGPPQYLGDLTHGLVHAGSPSLARRILELEKNNLKLVVTGHIHEAYGKYGIVYNVAHCTYPEYDPINPLVEVEL